MNTHKRPNPAPRRRRLGLSRRSVAVMLIASLVAALLVSALAVPSAQGAVLGSRPASTAACTVEGKVRIQGVRAPAPRTDLISTAYRCERGRDDRLAWVRLDTYQGPKVYGNLPFDPVPPSGSPKDIAQAFVSDATNLANCISRLFPACAVPVWGVRDTRDLELEEIRAPWRALWRKYEQIGVNVYHVNGPFTEEFPDGVPSFRYFYRLTVDGETFGVRMRSDVTGGFRWRDPSTWYVPGCVVCQAYELVEL